MSKELRNYIKDFKHFQINEIFKSEQIYNVTLDEYKEYNNSKSYRYQFITKDDIKYRVLFSIKNNGVGRIDFDTISEKNIKHNSIFQLINTGDVYKVINTLKSIIDKHKDVKELVISSSKERIKFYKKILDYMNIRNKYIDGVLIGYLG